MKQYKAKRKTTTLFSLRGPKIQGFLYTAYQEFIKSFDKYSHNTFEDKVYWVTGETEVHVNSSLDSAGQTWQKSHLLKNIGTSWVKGRFLKPQS